MKKIGQWAKNSRQAAEAEMRQIEDRKKRLWEEAREMRRFENAQVGRNASEVSLPDSFMTRLEL